MGARPMLMQPETGSAEAVIVLQESFQFLELPGFEVVQGLPVIGLSRRCKLSGLPRSARSVSW
jgi:hypothetical protein